MAHPHTTLFRKICSNLYPEFHHAYGEIARQQPTPTKAKAAAASLKGMLMEGVLEGLARTSHTILDANNLPENASGWVFQPICGDVNLWRTHGPISMQLIMLHEGQPTWAGIWMPLNSPDTRQDFVFVELGQGAMWNTRLRMGAKSSEELDALILTDVAQSASNRHFRVTGCRMADLVAVCAGCADGLLYTNEPTPVEAMVETFLLKEAGGQS